MSPTKLHYFVIITLAEWFAHLKEIEFRFSKNALEENLKNKIQRISLPNGIFCKVWLKLAVQF